jgi:hypothetical protein
MGPGFHRQPVWILSDKLLKARGDGLLGGRFGEGNERPRRMAIPGPWPLLLWTHHAVAGVLTHVILRCPSGQYGNSAEIDSVALLEPAVDLVHTVWATMSIQR